MVWFKECYIYNSIHSANNVKITQYCDINFGETDERPLENHIGTHLILFTTASLIYRIHGNMKYLFEEIKWTGFQSMDWWSFGWFIWHSLSFFIWVPDRHPFLPNLFVFSKPKSLLFCEMCWLFSPLLICLLEVQLPIRTGALLRFRNC